MTIDQAISLLKSNGYRVTRPRGAVDRATLGLNAIGKPYGANFDPNYRIRTPLTSIRRLSAPYSGNMRFVPDPPAAR